MEQNTKENQCEETCKQVWPFNRPCNFLKTGVITGVSVSGCFESLAVSKLPMIISKWPNNLSGNFKTFLGFEMV